MGSAARRDIQIFNGGTEYTLDFIPEAKFEIVIQDELVRKPVQVIGNMPESEKLGTRKYLLWQLKKQFESERESAAWRQVVWRGITQ